MLTIHFHSPCFDGVASAVVAADFLQANGGDRTIRFEPVNYDLKSVWLSRTLPPHSAVVDFLYHPTSLLTPDARADFESRKDEHFIYDPSAPSCAGLLWKHLAHAFGHRNHRFSPLVSAAEKTDSAAYESPQEAVFGNSPAIRLNHSLALGHDAQLYSVHLAALLLKQDIDLVLKEPEVSKRVETAEQLMRKGLARVQDALRITSRGIAVFSVRGNGAIIPRYSAFLSAPDAPYSVGLVKEGQRAKITAMRNPWIEFPSVDLGILFSRYGGGGHHRVASVMLDRQNTGSAEAMLLSIVNEVESSMDKIHSQRRQTR
jgi:nanoRNase/pAp phosphatase (c-di-AMP/oligoRNAs hydrolase)